MDKSASKRRISFGAVAIVLASLLTACGSGGAFHLRGTQTPVQKPAAVTTDIKSVERRIAIEGTDAEQGMGLELAKALSVGKIAVDEEADTKLIITELQEDKRASAFTTGRIISQFLIFNKFEYEVQVGDKSLGKYRIDINETQNYDSTFIIAMREEQRQIRDTLRIEAARLVMLRLNSIVPWRKTP